MPIPTVDHDERRRRIAEIAVDVIAREGLDAATIRRIAAALGGPTKLVTHYFIDKHEMLRWAYQALTEQHALALDQVIARDAADILGVLLAMCPVDEASLRRWRVYVAFWAWAARDDLIAEIQRQQVAIAVTRIADLLSARGRQGDLESVSERLNAIVQGLAVQALLDGARWTPARIRARLEEEIAVVLA